MPISLLEDGFFRPTPMDSPPEDSAVSFLVCPAGSAVQATWFKGVVTGRAGTSPETFAVVYLGEASIALDNDRMTALRQELPTVFGDAHVLIASSGAEGAACLHHRFRGETLLRWAAVLSVVQAAAMWDETVPIRVSCDHHTVACHPTFDGTLSQWRCEATLESP